MCISKTPRCPSANPIKVGTSKKGQGNQTLVVPSGTDTDTDSAYMPERFSLSGSNNVVDNAALLLRVGLRRYASHSKIPSQIGNLRLKSDGDAGGRPKQSAKLPLMIRIVNPS